jgi:hypothetical protein
MPKEDCANTRQDTNIKVADSVENIEVGITGDHFVRAIIDNDEYNNEVAVSMNKDGIVENSSIDDKAGIGAFKISGENINAVIWSGGIRFFTELDPGDYGFGYKYSETYFNQIVVNRYEESQGGAYPKVQATVLKITGGICINGKKDKIVGWRPVVFSADSNRIPFKLTSGKLQSEKISSFELSINDEPVDLGTKYDELKIDYMDAVINKIILSQDEQCGYIEVGIAGKAKSIKLDSKEIIESAIFKLISNPNYKSTITGLLFLFLISAAGMFLKRSLEILAEAWLPKDKPDN